MVFLLLQSVNIHPTLLINEMKVILNICLFYVTLVPEVFLDFSWRKRSTASRDAATTSRVSDEEREKNLWLP